MLAENLMILADFVVQFEHKFKFEAVLLHAQHTQSYILHAFSAGFFSILYPVD